MPGVAGAIVQPRAASLWPYKLVSHILEGLLRDFSAANFNLQTTTPVTSVARDRNNSWKVSTPRGTILAKKILLATNGYTSHLLPAMSDLIVPVRGQISALLPASTGHDVPQLPHSYVFASQETSATPWRDDYMVQRPVASSPSSPGTSQGEFIFGGGRGQALNKGISSSSDDEVEAPVSEFLRTHLAPPLDLHSTPTPIPNSTSTELKASYSWTGIMGYSRDGHPWVGNVPSSLGEGEGIFVCAGYTGHGMPNAALSAQEVVRIMRGESEAKGNLPRSYVVSDERVERVRKGDTIQEAQGKDVWVEAFPELGMKGLE